MHFITERVVNPVHTHAYGRACNHLPVHMNTDIRFGAWTQLSYPVHTNWREHAIQFGVLAQIPDCTGRSCDVVLVTWRTRILREEEVTSVVVCLCLALAVGSLSHRQPACLVTPGLLILLDMVQHPIEMRRRTRRSESFRERDV